MTEEKILAVPTNIITGFLGTGKTSAILKLIEQKPEGERWAILVNEFGEIGVDGSLFSGRTEKDQRVFIKEVPGGCMCCASGLPMQIALNLLLNQAKPDRLLIEPTGLGHPIEVLQVLSNQYYQTVLSLEKTITLVDARHFSDTRYTKHETFNQQIRIADSIVANKSDLANAQQQQTLQQYLNEHQYNDKPLYYTEYGALELDWLSGKTAYQCSSKNHSHQHKANNALASDQPLPKAGYIKAINQGEGYQSVGWRFSPELIFDRDKLDSFIRSIAAVRVKAVFITQQGVWGFNNTEDGHHMFELDDCLESRIEIIARDVCDSWQTQLDNCIAS